MLLLLAGVSISMLTGENGIINYAGKAVEETTIAEEKEQIDTAYVYAYTNKLGNYVTAEELQKELNKLADTTVTENDDNTLNVVFNETKNNYNVDEGIIEKVENTEILENYIVDGTIYCNTLTEALEAAKDGSTIKLIKNVTETGSIIIDKSITIDTNNKNVNFENSSLITINSETNVVINGGGEFSRETTGASFIVNNGKLEVNETTITSYSDFGSDATIYNELGTLILNNSKISNTGGYSVFYGDVTINGGNYGKIMGNIIVNSGNIDEIQLGSGCTVIIYGGKITDIKISHYDAHSLTIGDMNSEINTSNPEINNLYISEGLIYESLIINFYNGIIKNCSFDFDEILCDQEEWFYTRNGYTTQTTDSGTILVIE